VFRKIATCCALTFLGGIALAMSPADHPHVDHILLGAADLERATELVYQKTGVRPVYGGKHPRGTHNALLSLGKATYLEIIAVQPGAKPPEGFAGLAQLEKPALIDWAVSGGDANALRESLEKAGFRLTPLVPGSRTTPAGATLHWQVFGFADAFPLAPFFITWSPDTPHPASTSPAGCTVKRFALAAPDTGALTKLKTALQLDIQVGAGKSPAFTLELDCPKGPVTLTGP
jgi:hypothetical protein